MNPQKRIALVAHDERKKDLIEWSLKNKEKLSKHALFATGTTGRLIAEACQLDITALKSGPLGGDQQLGAMIATRALDILIFFWDPMTAQPHDVDIKALLRLTAVYNIPVACNRASADFFITSQFFDQVYQNTQKDYQTYLVRKI